jgi:hypothetical protein
MLNTAGAAAAAATLTAWVVSPSTQVTVGGALSIDGSASWAVAPHAITTRTWSIQSGAGAATLQVSGDQRTATVTGANPGTVVVRLSIADDQGGTAVSDTTIAVVAAAPADDGGGSMSWPWMLALGIAVTALRPRRR